MANIYQKTIKLKNKIAMVRSAPYNHAPQEDDAAWQYVEAAILQNAIPEATVVKKTRLLSEGDVQIIRRLLKAGIPMEMIALAFKCSYHTIRAINCHKNWHQLPYQIPCLDNKTGPTGKPILYFSLARYRGSDATNLVDAMGKIISNECKDRAEAMAFLKKAYGDIADIQLHESLMDPPKAPWEY